MITADADFMPTPGAFIPNILYLMITADADFTPTLGAFIPNILYVNGNLPGNVCICITPLNVPAFVCRDRSLCVRLVHGYGSNVGKEISENVWV